MFFTPVGWGGVDGGGPHVACLLQEMIMSPCRNVALSNLRKPHDALSNLRTPHVGLPNLRKPYVAMSILRKCRVAKSACPHVHHDQKMRSGCPPDYHIFWGKYFENNCPYKFFKDFILTLSFSNKHIILET